MMVCIQTLGEYQSHDFDIRHVQAHTSNAKKRDADAIKYCTGRLDRGAEAQGPVLLQDGRMGIVGSPVHDASNCQRGHCHNLKKFMVRS